MSGEVLVRLSDARLGYGGVAQLEGVNWEVRRGEFWVVVGPNGAGKTTLLRSLLGVLPLVGGRREVTGRLGYCPQRGGLDPVYPFTAGEVVAMGLLRPGAALRSSAVERAEVEAALRACGVEAHVDRAFRDLSGGQRQRVLVARALLGSPDVLVLDEPTNNLDLRGEQEVLEVVGRLHASGRTVVCVSHALRVAERHGERVACVAGGRLEVGTSEALLAPARLQELFGVEVSEQAQGD